MYQIKCYDLAKVYKRTINPNVIKSRISFTKQINWWAWQLILQLDLSLDNSDYIQGDIIEVYNFASWSSNLVYVWYINEIIKKSTNYAETELRINWLASLLTKVIYNVAWNFTTTLSADPYVSAQAVVTYFNTKYNYLTASWSNTWVTINYTLDYTDSFKVIDDLNKLSQTYYWYLNNYTLNFKPKPWTATHTFTLQKDLVELTLEEDTSELVNKLYLTYNWWTNTYSDATSITTYWLRESYITDTSIANNASANEYWNKYITDNKNPKQKIKLTINNLADINNINPWDTCKIRNSKKVFNDNLLISKIQYNQYSITLDLESFDNFINLIKQ